MGKQKLGLLSYDSRLQGNWYQWADAYGNRYTHYTKRQADGYFYGVFYNKRTDKGIRYYFRTKKAVYSRLRKIYHKYDSKWDKKEANLTKKRAEREAAKPKLTPKEKKIVEIQAKLDRLANNIKNNERKIRTCNTRISTYQKKTKYHMKRLAVLQS
jgi:hypothetical protein